MKDFILYVGGIGLIAKEVSWQPGVSAGRERVMAAKHIRVLNPKITHIGAPGIFSDAREREREVCRREWEVSAPIHLW